MLFGFLSPSSFSHHAATAWVRMQGPAENVNARPHLTNQLASTNFTSVAVKPMSPYVSNNKVLTMSTVIMVEFLRNMSSGVVEGIDNDKTRRDNDKMLLLTVLVNNTEYLSVRSGNLHISLVTC